MTMAQDFGQICSVVKSRWLYYFLESSGWTGYCAITCIQTDTQACTHISTSVMTWLRAK